MWRLIIQAIFLFVISIIRALAILKIDPSGTTTTISGAGSGSFSGCAVDVVRDDVFYTNQGHIYEVKKMAFII